MPQPPNCRFLLSHPAHFIAQGCGSGLSPFAPGTAGTLFAWLTFPLPRHFLADNAFLIFLATAFVIGVACVQKTGRDLGETDHGSIVWDEIVPFWGVLLMTPAGFLWQCAAFFLFRFFDVVKPQPARYFDEKVKNGLGVMMDDVIAAAYTLLCLALAKWALG